MAAWNKGHRKYKDRICPTCKQPFYPKIRGQTFCCRRCYIESEEIHKYGEKNLGKSAWNKGLTKETDERVLRNSISTSKALEGKPNLALRGRKFPERNAHRRTPLETRICVVCKKEFQRQINGSQIHCSQYCSTQNPEKNRRHSQILTGRPSGRAGEKNSPDHRRKISAALIKYSKTKRGREHLRRAGILGHKACSNKQTEPEFQLQTLLDQHFPGQWKYVGDGQVIIGYRNPDFINCNGQKALIEMFGDYWHGSEVTSNSREDEEWQRIDRFSQYGFRTLVIWEHELREPEKVIQKTRVFTELG